ncbi:hypothetical protein NE237_001884 [Protea cynaroides]|uniref:ADP-ribosyl cyclase/cyclic ADP-ribose hydrolase n=1 Tax=Protea cynaroides TaxID=273540 RepID=A0A9Q0KTY6_9MAGN|nr:hypothetical protein NE237_001884 [Protea cynaroides]
MVALDSASSSSCALQLDLLLYDVFLNFRGKDTHNNFIGFLHTALKNSGINVSVDSEKLWIGEAICPALRRAIEGFKILIPVFSKGYANNKWCLWEVAQIVQCHRSKGQLVCPYSSTLIHRMFGIGPENLGQHFGNIRRISRLISCRVGRML